MRSIYLMAMMQLSMIIGAMAQQPGTVSGRLYMEDGEPAGYVTVFSQSAKKGVTSDERGNFSLSVPAGLDTLIFESVQVEKLLKPVRIWSGEEVKLDVQLFYDVTKMEEVVVSATRIAEPLTETPSSITLLDKKAIEQSAAYSNNLADILNYVPGMPLSSNTTGNRGQTLRGRNTLILIDGIPQSTPLRNGSRDINTISPEVIERIEVIKGATAIYGNGADGGIINYITKKPVGNRPISGSTSFHAGSSLVNAQKTFGGGITQQFSGRIGKAGYLLSGSFRQTGVFRDANGEILSPYYGLGESNIYNFFGKTNYRLNEKSDLQLMYNFYSSNQNTNYITQPGVYGERPAIGVIGEVKGEPEGNRFNHNAQLNYSSRDLFLGTDLTVNAYLQDFTTVYSYSAFFTDTINGYDGGQSQIVSDKKGLRINLRTPVTTSFAKADLVYGMDILQDITEQSLVDGRSWVPETNMKNYAPYLQLKTTVRENLVVKAGARFENIRIDIPDYSTIFITPYGANPQGGVSISGGVMNYNALVYNLGLRFTRYDGFNPFVSYSQSFSIADLGRTLRTATENTLSRINSEALIVDNYEAGFSSLIGDRINLNANVFISTSDLGSSYQEVNGIFQIARQPEKVYGAELDADVRLSDHWNVGGSFTYTEGKFDSNMDGRYDSRDKFINSDRIPPVKTILYLGYLRSAFNFRLTGIFTGSRDHFQPGETGAFVYGQAPVEPVQLVNLSAGYALTPQTKLSLGVENLLNADYYTLSSQWQGRSDEYIKGNGARFNLTMTVDFH